MRDRSVCFIVAHILGGGGGGGMGNACTRVPIHFSEKLQMKNKNFSSFSFFIFAEN